MLLLDLHFFNMLELDRNSTNKLLKVNKSVFFLCFSITSTLKFKDLIPVLYQEGRYQGDPVTLGVGGFGRVQLVCFVHSPFTYVYEELIGTN